MCVLCRTNNTYAVDYVLRALSSLSTPEEKLAALCKKYTDLLDENRQHASAVKSNAKKLSTVSRERDSLQTENSKLILAKSKLENLCRELQRHNKVVKVWQMPAVLVQHSSARSYLGQPLLGW